MRLQFNINSQDTPKQFSCFLKGLVLANSIRKSAIFKFKEEELLIILTTGSGFSSSSSTSISGNTGSSSQSDSQLWLKISVEPLLQSYVIKTKRVDRSVSMELALQPLIQILRQYDQMMKRGDQAHINAATMGNLEVRMTNVPKEWNLLMLDGSSGQGHQNTKGQNMKNGGYGALRVSFEEQVPGKPTPLKHVTYIPLKLLSSQYELRQPVINADQVVYNLPQQNDMEEGKQFGRFMKRLDRFSGLEHLKVCGTTQELKLVVDEMDWFMEVKWNGVIDVLNRDTLTQHEEEEEEEQGHEVRLTTEEQSVIIRAKDWKMCTRLFDVLGEQTFLCISNKRYCLFNCMIKNTDSVDADSLTQSHDSLAEHGNRFMDVSFYIANCRSF